ncbi:hypothetical protein DSECCO2_572490 [anaerobic digester metagenome]
MHHFGDAFFTGSRFTLNQNNDVKGRDFHQYIDDGFVYVADINHIVHGHIVFFQRG